MSEDRLRRIEELLVMILRRIEELENSIRIHDPQAASSISLAGKLMMTFSMPALRALKAASLILKLTSKVDVEDDVSKAIIEALASSKNEVTISELTRMVKALRGKASRRIIASKVKTLHSRGIVATRKSGNRVYVKLAKEG